MKNPKLFLSLRKAFKLPKTHKDKIPGGLADKKHPKDFDQEQLQQGIKVEMEHTTSKDLAMEIAMDHLTEDKHYYKKLARMEGHE